MLSDITPLVLTFNEAPNLARALARLAWARQVIVLDSGSTDDTQAIASGFPNVRVIVRPFDDHTRQWNHGVELVETPWVLALDADYVLSIGFEGELAALAPQAGVDAFYAGFRYLIFGQALRGSLYPPRSVLFRKVRCCYVQDGHTQMLSIPGVTGRLHSLIDHDDRKPLSRWLASQSAYARLEAEKLLSADPSSLRLQDRLRLTRWAAIPACFLYTLLVKGMLWDGWRGWYYTLQRTLAEMVLALHLIERKAP